VCHSLLGNAFVYSFCAHLQSAKWGFRNQNHQSSNKLYAKFSCFLPNNRVYVAKIKCTLHNNS
jgi:hypothetical protein